mmetsp:Transcript_77391/g.213951  ORF Transcript_77391/g.213951 Transcript_77391/m.213951 type:complete len:243 (+) Transcript_77391:208-936(+)
MLQVPTAQAAQEEERPPRQRHTQRRPQDRGVQGPQGQVASAQEADAGNGPKHAAVVVVVELDVGLRCCVVVVDVHLIEVVLPGKGRVRRGAEEALRQAADPFLQPLARHHGRHLAEPRGDHRQRGLRGARGRPRENRPIVEPAPARELLVCAEGKDRAVRTPVLCQLGLFLNAQEVLHDVEAQVAQKFSLHIHAQGERPQGIHVGHEGGEVPLLPRLPEAAVGVDDGHPPLLDIRGPQVTTA